MPLVAVATARQFPRKAGQTQCSADESGSGPFPRQQMRSLSRRKTGRGELAVAIAMTAEMVGQPAAEGGGRNPGGEVADVLIATSGLFGLEECDSRTLCQKSRKALSYERSSIQSDGR